MVVRQVLGSDPDPYSLGLVLAFAPRDWSSPEAALPTPQAGFMSGPWQGAARGRWWHQVTCQAKVLHAGR